MRHIFIRQQLRKRDSFAQAWRPGDDDAVDFAGATEVLDPLGAADHRGIKNEVVFGVFRDRRHARDEFGKEVGDAVNGIGDDQPNLVGALPAEIAGGG